jgi:beta-N-acetylhexosaminidase
MKNKAFSIEQLAGQRLMVGFEGTVLTQELKHLIDTLMIGGIILFSRNIAPPEQLRDLCRSVQVYARSCGQPPLFIAIDQEGGPVARLMEPFTRFPGNPKMQDEEDAVRFAKVTAAELTGVGVNMNMAPVLDLAPGDIDSVMATRSFGDDPLRVSELGVKVIEYLQQGNVMAVAKHFPGIGRTTVDSHHELPVLSVELADLESTDLIPFKTAVEHGVAGIMLSHTLYEKIDPVWPASLSARISKELLRGRMGFEGIVVTDDLDMGAIDGNYPIPAAINQILSADIDIALICHPGPNIEIAFESIAGGISDSPEYRSMAKKSVQRILKLKQKYLGYGH